MAIAATVHCGQRLLNGEVLLADIERVAAGVPGWARAVAWLHEVLERTDLSEEQLLRMGALGRGIARVAAALPGSIMLESGLSRPHQADSAGGRCGWAYRMHSEAGGPRVDSFIPLFVPKAGHRRTETRSITLQRAMSPRARAGANRRPCGEIMVAPGLSLPESPDYETRR